jgi:hypothetical protein
MVAMSKGGRVIGQFDVARILLCMYVRVMFDH